MKNKNLFLALIGLVFLFSSCSNNNFNPNSKLTTDLDSVSYAIGVDIANSLTSAGVEEVNYDAFFDGLKNSIEGNDLKIDKESIKPIIQKYFTDIRIKKLAENLEEGRAFLEKNKEKEGIIVTESGLQYEVIEEGTGKTPTATSKVKCHYHGTLIDGTVFDSSVERGEPMDFVLNRVIPGWTEGVQLMKEGAKYKFYIPTELGYGERVRPGGKIEGNMALIFEVELIEVLPEESQN